MVASKNAEEKSGILHRRLLPAGDGFVDQHGQRAVNKTINDTHGEHARTMRALFSGFSSSKSFMPAFLHLLTSLGNLLFS